MKLAKFSFFISCMVLFTNCEQADPVEEIKKEQEDPKPEEKPQEPQEPQKDSTITYFTLNRASAFADDENWLVINNQDGELLDYKEFEKGDSMVFEALQSQLENTQELTITIVRSNVEQNNGNHNIRTYTGIDKESIWDQQAESTTGGSGKFENGSGNVRKLPVQKLSEKNAASYNIIVNNVPGIERYTLTSKEHYSVTGGQIPQYNVTILNINQVNLELNVEYLLSIEDGEGMLKYHLLFAPEVNEDITLDYADFLEYDHVLEVALPEHSHLNAQVTGYESEVFLGSPLLLSSQLTGGPSDAFARFGYLDDYEEFDTYFTVRTLDNYGYGYEELGKIPDTMVVMEKPSFTLQKASLSEISFSTDINYLRSFSLWNIIETLPDNSINQTQWYINAPHGNIIKIGFLPEEIIEKYPTLNLDDLGYIRTDLILKGRTYEDELNSVSNQITVRPLKYEWLSFYNPEE